MSAPQKALVPQLHPLSIVRMFWKRKVVVGLVWVLGSAIAGAVVWKLPPVYTAEALIVIDSQKIPDRYVTATVSSELQDRIATIGQEITSSSQLKKIIDDFGLYKDERRTLFQEEILDKMKKDINVVLEKGWTRDRPGAFRISYQGSDPAIVAQVANRLANLYIEENLRVREVQAEGTSEFMDTQLTEAKKKLDDLEAALSQYKLKHNGELPQQENAISAELARMDLALQANREAGRRADQSMKILDDTLSIAEATVTALSQTQPEPSTASTVTNPVTGAIVTVPQSSSPAGKRVELLRAKLEAMHDEGYADGHPDVKAVQAELASALAELARETKTGKEQPPPSEKKGTMPATQPPPPVDRTVAAARSQGQIERERGLAQARERVSTLKIEISTLKQESQDLKTNQAKIAENITLLETRLGSLPVREQEMAGLTRDYEISKANYKTLLDKKLSAEMATDMERRQKSERFTLLDPARVPMKPAKPNRPLFAGVGSVLALALGGLLGFVLEMRRNCILGEWELPKGVVVLGRVPVIELSAASGPFHAPTGRTSRRLRWMLTFASIFLLAILAAGVYAAKARF